MHTATLSPPEASPASPPAEFRWDGHMSDDVASTYGATPCAFLQANARELYLCGSRGRFLLPRSAVRLISKGTLYPWIFASVRIHHDNPKFPRELQFKPLGTSFRAVLAQLRELEYPVK